MSVYRACLSKTLMPYIRLSRPSEAFMEQGANLVGLLLTSSWLWNSSWGPNCLFKLITRKTQSHLHRSAITVTSCPWWLLFLWVLESLCQVFVSLTKAQRWSWVTHLMLPSFGFLVYEGAWRSHLFPPNWGDNQVKHSWNIKHNRNAIFPFLAKFFGRFCKYLFKGSVSERMKGRKR